MTRILPIMLAGEPLTPDMRRVARLLATGQVLLVAAGAPGVPAGTGEELLIVKEEPAPDFEGMARALGLGCDTNCTEWEPPAELRREREPWRRGRPLRNR